MKKITPTFACALLVATLLACSTRPRAPLTGVAPCVSTNAPAVQASVGTKALSLLTCTFDVHARSLGPKGAHYPTAPVWVGDAFLAAYLQTTPHALWVHRIEIDGTVGPGHKVREGARLSAPRLAAYGDDIVLTVADENKTEGIYLNRDGTPNATRPPIAMPESIEDLSVGPRGPLVTYAASEERLIVREMKRTPSLVSHAAPPPWMPEPQEQLIASGEEADVALAPSAHETKLLAFAPGASKPSSEDAIVTDKSPVEASVAAGKLGFLVASTEWNIITLHRFDTRGVTLGSPVSFGTLPTVRYPRVGSIPSGWVVTYWDGIGPSIVRFDEAGHAVHRPMPLRTGDERGGHTDARIAVGTSSLAVTWYVGPPAMGHGKAIEEPTHPGPRVAVLTCEGSP